MLQEFGDVFLYEVLGVNPKRDIEFTIDIFLGFVALTMTTYRMSTLELLEMKLQLQELLKNKYIRKSVSPWGSLMLFVKRKIEPLGYVLIIYN